MAVDLRLERLWSTSLNDGQLPDSRLHIRERDRVYRGHMIWDKVYCADCGRLYGLVTSDWSPHVFALCDRCAEKAAALELRKVSAEDERKMSG